MSRERSMEKGASLGKEAVLAALGWAGEVAAGIGRVRIATFSASWCQSHRSRHEMHSPCFDRRHND
jgi:hypothetical protein